MSFLEDADHHHHGYGIEIVHPDFKASITQLPCQYECSLGFPISYKTSSKKILT